MTRDPWRYRSPCCGYSSVNWRPASGVWYCHGCGGHCTHLVDAKTGESVTRAEAVRQ